MEPKVSVIIPIYHPKREYIDRLMDSVARQTIGMEKIEVILVSDGDQSQETKEILSSWEERYPENILVIYYEENRRPGYARTLGMDYARGKFIAFADQDDWLSLEMYRVLVERAEEFGCDIAGGHSTRDQEYRRPVAERTFTGEKDVLWEIQDSASRKKFLMEGKLGGYWCSIYRRDFLEEHGIYYPADVTYDDNFFGALTRFYAKKVLVMGEYFYHWFVNDQSISIRQDGSTYFDRLKVELLKLEELKRRGFFGEYRDEIEMMFIQMYFINTMHAFFWHLNDVPYEIYKDMCHTVGREFPTYRHNPYFHSGLDEYESAAWCYYPTIYQYYRDKGDQENIQILEKVPEKVRKVCWLDVMEGDLTEVELTWFKIIYLLLPSP